jgi:hypothetical protein
MWGIRLPQVLFNEQFRAMAGVTRIEIMLIFASVALVQAVVSLPLREAAAPLGASGGQRAGGQRSMEIE